MPGTVTVACKLPLGIIMQEFKMMPEREQTQNGVRDIQVGRPTGRSVVINGVAHAPGKQPISRVNGAPVHVIQSGYALTPDVDEDLWNNWLSFHKDHPMVINRMIYASAKSADVHAIGRENQSRRSGLEPMDRPTAENPAGDPRAPAKRQRIGEGRVVSEIMTAEKAA